MKYGLDDSVIEKITEVLEGNPKVDKAYIFGSRAKGNYRPGSDIDIAVKGYNLTLHDILQMSGALDDTNIAYKIDLLNYDSIKEPALTEHIDRVGVEFYSRWGKCKLGDAINLKRGYDLPNAMRSEGIYPIFSSSGITGYHNQFMKEPPGVITGRYGTIGEVFYTTEKYWPLNTTLYVQDFKGNNPKFIYYFLKKFDFGKYSDKSAVPGINRNDVHEEKILLPDNSSQTVMASILTSLDDKIDLLHRQNKTLEELAEVLFRQWFVEEAEEGWEEGRLRDIAEHFKENIIPLKTPDVFFYHYSLPAFDEGKNPKMELGKEILSNKYKVIPNSILISKLNPRFPRIWELYGNDVPDNSVCSTEFQIAKPKQISYFEFIYCFLKSNQVVQELTGAAGGTSGSHQRVSPHDIFNLSFSMPPKDLIERFHLLTMHHFQKIKSNSKQIGSLTQLRDNLLPKLMSGEVRVRM